MNRTVRYPTGRLVYTTASRVSIPKVGHLVAVSGTDIPKGIRGIPLRLKRARMALASDRAGRVTQGEIAAAIGVTEGQIGHWESGRQTPDVAWLTRLARALRVSEAWLISGIEPMATEYPAETDEQFRRRTGLTPRARKPVTDLQKAGKKTAAKKNGGRRA